MGHAREEARAGIYEHASKANHSGPGVAAGDEEFLEAVRPKSQWRYPLRVDELQKIIASRG